MEPEDDLTLIFGFGDHGIKAITDYGSGNLVQLIRIHNENLNSSSGEIGASTVRGLARMDTTNRNIAHSCGLPSAT